MISEYAKLGITDAALIAEKHICACSTNIKETDKFGINKNNVFGFWDFVGGRFSVWSAIGVLPLSIHFGYETASEFLAGGHSIDGLLLNERDITVRLFIILEKYSSPVRTSWVLQNFNFRVHSSSHHPLLPSFMQICPSHPTARYGKQR